MSSWGKALRCLMPGLAAMSILSTLAFPMALRGGVPAARVRKVGCWGWKIKERVRVKIAERFAGL